MKIKGKSIKVSRENYRLFLTLVLLWEIGYWILIILTRKELWNTYFVTDYHDTFMDYFNMLGLLKDGDPIAQGANYPAMCFLILRVLARIMPVEGFTSVVDPYHLREYEPACLGFILFMILSVSMIIIGIELILAKYIRDYKIRLMSLLTVLLSGPFLFTVERGNFIILSVGFSLCYVALYDSDKIKNRILSYFFLSMAAAIKIYPALLGLLTVDRIFRINKEFKSQAIRETIYLVLMGCTVFLLPFLTYDGALTFRQMLHNIRTAGVLQSSQGANINFSMLNLCKIVLMILTHGRFNTIPANDSWQMLGVIIPVFIFFTTKERWQKAYSLVLVCIWYPMFSYTYTLMFFLIPLLIMFSDHREAHGLDLKKMGMHNRLEFIILIFIQLPYCLPELGVDIEDAKFPLSGGTALINGLIAILSIDLVIIGIRQLKCSRDNKNSKYHL